jgi:hypothetical protein
VTRDDIIAAHPGVAYQDATVNGRPALLFTAADGAETMVIWRGDLHVAIAGPRTPAIVEAALSTLDLGQPGIEFATVGDDEFAAAMRLIGIGVVRTADNHARAEYEKAA